jgi:metal-responsive CopG/Arc/MetJ family transcriptional regulator
MTIYVYHTHMDRFQIYLPEPMLKRLREIADKEGYSVAEVIRRMVQKQLDEKEQK